MKKSMLLVMFMVSVMGLSACGSISDKVTQNLDTIEVGEAFDLDSFFEAEEGITISLKDSSIDMYDIGPHSIDLIISDGKKEEERTYTINVVDTQAPVISTRDISIYIGSEFNAEELATAYDNSGENISVVVKSSDVDVSTSGRYYITYEATDSSGNSSEKVAIIEVMSLDSPEDVMDIVDQYLTEEGLSGFKYSMNQFDAVFVTSPRLSTVVIDEGRNVTMYPEIYINNNIFSMSSDYPIGKFGVVGICLRFEFSDRTDPQSDRHALNADRITISSGGNSFTNSSSGLPEVGEYSRTEYFSTFTYTLGYDELKQLEAMLNEGSVVLTVDACDTEFDIQTLDYIDYPYSFVYELNESDIELFLTTMDVYNYLVEFLGRYN